VGISKNHALPGDLVYLGRGRPFKAVTAQMIRPAGVDADQYYVAYGAALLKQIPAYTSNCDQSQKQGHIYNSNRFLVSWFHFVIFSPYIHTYSPLLYYYYNGIFPRILPFFRLFG